MTRARSRLGAFVLSFALAPTLHAQAAGKQAAPASSAQKPSAVPAVAELSPKLELEGPEAEAKERAREVFKRGVAAYRAGDYYEAVELFLATQRIYPDTQLCFNVARAYENLGNESAALNHYREYLRRSDRPSDGAEVIERVHLLESSLAEKGLQQLTVVTAPEGATVLLDGRAVGLSPWTGEAFPGKHRLAFELRGHVPSELIIDVDAHAARDFNQTLLAEPPPRAVVPPLGALTAARARAQVELGTLLVLGAGAVLLGSAVAIQSTSHESGLSPTSAFFAGGGLGLSLVGGAMLYFDLVPDGALRRQSGRRYGISAFGFERSAIRNARF